MFVASPIPRPPATQNAATQNDVVIGLCFEWPPLALSLFKAISSMSGYGGIAMLGDGRVIMRPIVKCLERLEVCFAQ